MQPRTSEVHRFAEFVLDVEDRRLTRKGEPVVLQDLPLTALLALVGGGGRIVGRDELAAALWGADVFVDTDSGLNTAIRKLREALGDSSSDPRFIETVPRRGYRFLVPTKTSTPVWTQGRGPRSGWRATSSLLAGAAGALATLAVVGMLVPRTESRRPAGEGPTAPLANLARVQCAHETTVRVAVLPIELEGAEEPAGPQLRSTLTEDVVGALWNVDGIRLAAHRVAREAAISPAASDVVLAGNLQRTPEGLRLTVRLLEPEHLSIVWERTFTAPAQDPFLLHPQVAATVASFLSAAVS